VFISPNFVVGSSLTAFEQTAGPFVKPMKSAIAFSSEVDAGSHEETRQG
jgi:hypothetical protein